MKKQLMSLAALVPLIGFSQQVERQVISGSGGLATGKTTTVEQVIGEPLVASRKGSKTQVSEGFLQGYKIKVVPLASKTEIAETTLVKVYPNPTTSFVTVDGITDSYTLTVLDVTGKTISSNNATGTAQLDFTNHATGTYNLQITYKNGKQAVYQVIKTN